VLGTFHLYHYRNDCSVCILRLSANFGATPKISELQNFRILNFWEHFGNRSQILVTVRNIFRTVPKIRNNKKIWNSSGYFGTVPNISETQRNAAQTRADLSSLLFGFLASSWVQERQGLGCWSGTTSSCRERGLEEEDAWCACRGAEQPYDAWRFEGLLR
jgi:hypothetical protein